MYRQGALRISSPSFTGKVKGIISASMLSVVHCPATSLIVFSLAILTFHCDSHLISGKLIVRVYGCGIVQ